MVSPAPSTGTIRDPLPNTSDRRLSFSMYSAALRPYFLPRLEGALSDGATLG